MSEACERVAATPQSAASEAESEPWQDVTSRRRSNCDIPSATPSCELTQAQLRNARKARQRQRVQVERRFARQPQEEQEREQEREQEQEQERQVEHADQADDTTTVSVANAVGVAEDLELPMHVELSQEGHAIVCAPVAAPCPPAPQVVPTWTEESEDVGIAIAAVKAVVGVTKAPKWAADDEAAAVEAPDRLLARCQRAWSGALSGFAVEEGCFVHVWADSCYSHGWVYGEALGDASCQGWLPLAVLQELPPGHRWMRTKQRCVVAVHPSQMSITEGSMLLVDTVSLRDGWVFAQEPMVSGSVGWVPTVCLEWTSDANWFRPEAPGGEPSWTA